MKYIDSETRSRIQNRGITDADIEYCLRNPREVYPHRRDTVNAATLPDGRHIKVKTDTSQAILNAFTHH